MKGLVYDCEIIQCIPDREMLSQYKYCAGWKDFENMGISVIGTCDIVTGELKAFVNSEWSHLGYPSFSEFQKLIYKVQLGGGSIIGFNSFNFDDSLCHANGIVVRSDYDLLRLVRLAAYGNVSWESQPCGYSYSLNAIASANGYAKTGSGGSAPKLWQDEKYQEVIDYCLNDCFITYKLFEKFANGELIDPNNGKILKPCILSD